MVAGESAASMPNAQPTVREEYRIVVRLKADGKVMVVDITDQPDRAAAEASWWEPQHDVTEVWTEVRTVTEGPWTRASVNGPSGGSHV